jgi:hypothetical protein
LILSMRTSAVGWTIAAGLISGLLWLIFLPLVLAVNAALNAFDLSARAFAFRELKDKAREAPAGTQELPKQDTN